MHLFLLASGLLASLTTAQNTSYAPPETLSFSGNIDPSQVNTYIYVPFTVPPHVTSIYVDRRFSDNDTNSLDLGIFDQRGYDPLTSVNGTNGFRGWSGWFRSNFTVAYANGQTTPSYIGGPITEGEWNVVLGPLNVAEGGMQWNVTVVLDYESVPDGAYYQPAYADVSLPLPDDLRAMQQPLSMVYDSEVWLRGDFHVHSVYSDGRYLPEEQVDNALKQDLDFFFFTEHNTYSGHAAMGAYQPRDGNRSLLIGRGLEVTTPYGHWQALGLEREQVVEWRYGPGVTPGYAEAVEQVHKSGGFASINHPFAEFNSGFWEYDDWESQDAIEVWNDGISMDVNDMAIAKWRELLCQGQRVTGIGGSDTHNFPSLIGRPTTVVRSRSLSQADIVYGVKKGLVYVVEGPGMELKLRAWIKGSGRVYEMGDVVSHDERRSAYLQLSSVGLHGYKACFFGNQGNWKNVTIDTKGGVKVKAPKGGSFVMVEVRNSTDGLVGMTNPVYFE